MRTTANGTDAPAPGEYEDILREESRQRRFGILQVLAVVLAVIVCSWLAGMLDGQRLSQGIPAIWTLFLDMLPPDFARWREWIQPMIDTVAMSVAGTALAVLFSLPLAFLAARNTTPHPTVYYVARMVLNLLRSVPELIMGIVFVAAVGFGMLPGVLALGLHSIGMVGKFYAESIEHTHPAPIEAARSVGAQPLQVITHGVLPQVFPQFADVTMYRWEYNFRASTIMGMVGAGGIGLELMSSLRIMEYNQVAAILIVVLVTVAFVDWLSGLLRQRFN